MSLFISHGAPDLPIRPGPTQDFLRQLFLTLPRPQAILAVSAHWLTAQPTVSKAERPETIYDFRGFPSELYQLTYPAPGHPELAAAIATNLTAAGFPTRINARRGLDHGVWTPLLLAAPEADIPIAQLSLQPQESPEYHFRLGQALAGVQQEGVLILASGAITHNLRALGDSYTADPPDWAVAFDDWLAAAIANNDIPSLLNYRQLAPHARQNHPTDEHLLPLFVALGAGGQGRQMHQGFTYGSLSMAAYAFD